jgi:hypothetical protein
MSEAILLILCSIVGVAQAQEITPRCPMPSSTVLYNLMQYAPDVVILELRGNEAKAAIEIFNSLPPAGEDAGDRFYIAFQPGTPLSRLIVANHGCIENGALVDLHTAVVIEKAAKKVQSGVSL